MEDYLSYLIAVHVLGSFALAYAALQRTVNFWLAFLISFVLTPVVGFLFVLCYPTYVEEDTKKYLKKLLERNVE